MLLPTLLMFLIYVYCYWGTYDRLVYCAFGEYKFGYWFTFALFLMNLVHWGVSALAGKLPVCDSNRSKLLLLLIAVMAVVLVGLKDWDWNSNRATLANWFSLRLIAMYFPFYFMGIVCRRYEQLFHKMIANGYITGMVTIAFALTMLHTGGGFYFALLQETLGVTLLYSLCYVCRNTLSDNTFVGRQLALIGRNTLPIYLIHYFMFLGLKFPVAGAVFDIHSQWLVVFFVAALLTLFVVYASIGMTKILVVSSPLRRVLIGK